MSFIVPALNEEAKIEDAVHTVLEAVGNSRVSEYEIILVNDGSTDGTGEIMEKQAHGHDRIKVLHNERNLGLGGAYKQGVRVARYEYVMIVAGDNCMPASDITLALNRLGEADIILQYLTNPKLRPLGRRIASRTFTLIVNTLFGLHIRYYNGMIPRRKILRTITISSDSYAFLAEAVVKLVKAGYSYVQVGIPNTPVMRGRSVALQPKRLWGVFIAIVNLLREMHRHGAVPSVADSRNQP